MKKIFVLIFFLIFPVISWAKIPKTYVFMSTSFNPGDEDSQNYFFSIRGNAYDDGQGFDLGYDNSRSASIPFRSNCQENPEIPCRTNTGNYKIYFYSKNTQICEYDYNIYTKIGDFVINEKYVPKGGDKPITCYARLIPGNVFIFVKSAK